MKRTIIIAAILLIAVSLYTWQRSELGITNQELGNGSTSSPQDWKTYRNEQYGFEVRYPDDWIAKEIRDTQNFQWGALVAVAFRPNRPEPGDPDYGLVTLSSYKSDLDVSQFMDSYLCEGPDVCASSEYAQDLTVSGLKAKKIINPPAPVESEAVFFKNHGSIYEFIIALDKSYEETYSIHDKKAIFDGMLSTFKFTK